MFPIKAANIIAPVVSLVLAAALTPLVRSLARRWGFVAKPKTDRWHKRPTAMMGGVAIWLAVILTDLALVPHTSTGWVVVGAASFLFLVGLVDDWLHIKPYQKLFGQVIGAAAVVNYGLLLPWTRSLPVNMVITIFWLIGITNAINLLDNMDGLATGIAAIASGFLTFNFIATGQTTEAMMLNGFLPAALTSFSPCPPGRSSNRGSSFAASVGAPSAAVRFRTPSSAVCSAAGDTPGSRRAMTRTHQYDGERHWPRLSMVCRTAIGSEIDGDSPITVP